MVMEVRVRDATTADADGIARCHVRGWQVGCAGLLDHDHLAGLSVEASVRRWASALSGEDHRVVVAEVDGVVAGFARTGVTVDPRPGEDPAPGELRELYVDPDHWGTGVAAALHDRAITDLRAVGFDVAALWVVDGNDRAIRFYRRRGWRADGWRRTETAGTASWQELRLRGHLGAAPSD